MNVKVLTTSGESSSSIELDDAIFAAKVSVPLMHQVVTAQLAAARAGTHSTKTRGEVRGGGAKPWRQKGTGRARHGSSREPQWKGGGIVFGPKPRDHSQSVPKKMKAAALRSALSVRAKDGKVFVVDGLASGTPKTKEAIAALKVWGLEGKVLLVLTPADRMTAYAFRNLPEVHVIAEHQLNVYDVMNADNVVFVRAAVEALQSRGKKDDEDDAAAPIAATTPPSEPEITREPSGDATPERSDGDVAAPERSDGDVEGGGS